MFNHWAIFPDLGKPWLIFAIFFFSILYLSRILECQEKIFTHLLKIGLLPFIDEQNEFLKDKVTPLRSWNASDEARDHLRLSHPLWCLLVPVKLKSCCPWRKSQAEHNQAEEEPSNTGPFSFRNTLLVPHSIWKQPTSDTESWCTGVQCEHAHCYLTI